MKNTTSAGSPMMTRRGVLSAGAVLGLGLLAGCSDSDDDAAETTDDATDDATDEASNKIGQPTDFVLDVETGDFTFTATDENAGYYFVRVYAAREGAVYGEQLAGSSRISGGTTGELSGNVDLSGLTSCGEYWANLVAYAPSGTDYVSSDPATVVIQCGAGNTFERPEMLAMWSGSEANLIVDWWSLTNYYTLQTMPYVKFTFYSDADLTTVAFEDQVDTYELTDRLVTTMSGYDWGTDKSTSATPLHTNTGELVVSSGNPFATTSEEDTDPIESFAFLYDLYTYSPGAGTYYVTAQAISPYDFINDSQETSAVELTLTDDDPSEPYEEGWTDLYEDPQNDGSDVFAAANTKLDRVDSGSAQTSTLSLAE